MRSDGGELFCAAPKDRVNESKLEAPTPHGLVQSVLLHLLPGIANVSFTYLAYRVFAESDFPFALAYSVLCNLLVLMPIQLGILFYLARKRGNRGWSLAGVVSYRAKHRWWRHFIWLTAILLPTALIMRLFDPVAETLMPIFEWVVVGQIDGYAGEHSQSVLVATFVLNTVFTGVLVPITEELYFRGYLLPRMPRKFGAAGPFVHSVLFAIYHFDTPWLIPARTFGLLPLILVTKHIKSVTPGILAHCLVNTFDIVARAADRLR